MAKAFTTIKQKLTGKRNTSSDSPSEKTRTSISLYGTVHVNVYLSEYIESSAKYAT